MHSQRRRRCLCTTLRHAVCQTFKFSQQINILAENSHTHAHAHKRRQQSNGFVCLSQRWAYTLLAAFLQSFDHFTHFTIVSNMTISNFVNVLTTSLHALDTRSHIDDLWSALPASWLTDWLPDWLPDELAR